MEIDEIKAYLQSSQNTLPLNYVLLEVKRVLSNEPLVRVKSIPVVKLNTKRYLVQIFYKSISKLPNYEVF